MNYAQIYEADIANGTGCRTSLFVSGCTHHCKGCFNSQAWDFNYGKPYTKDTEDYIISTLNKSYINGLSLLGGEPMELVNQAGLIRLIRRTKDIGKTIWIYSGYLYEELTDKNNSRCHGLYTDEILSLSDVLVDGEFHIEEKDISLKFRGSRNQRIIDLKKSAIAGVPILLDF